MSQIVHRISYFFLLGLLFYSKLMGLLPYTFNRSTNCLEDSPIGRIYSSVINAFVIVAMPITLHIFANHNALGVTNKLLAVVMFCDFLLLYLILVMTFIGHFRYRHRLLKLFNEMIAIATILYKRSQNCNHSALYLFVLVKTVLPVNQALSTLTVFSNESLRTDWPFIFCFFIAMMSANIMIIIMNSFSIASLIIRNFYDIINDELRTLLANLSQPRASYSYISRMRHFSDLNMQKCCDISDSIDQIAELNSKIYELVTDLTVLLRFQLLAIIAFTFLNTLSMWFYFYFLIPIFFKADRIDMTLGFCVSMLWNCADIFVLILGASLVSEGSNLAREIMDCRIESKMRDDRLDRSIESYSLQLIVKKLEINAGGLFVLDRSLIISLVSATGSYLLFLIQFDLGTINGSSPSNKTIPN